MSPSARQPVPEYVNQFQRIESYAEIQEIMRSSAFYQGRTPERDAFFGDTLIMIDGKEHVERKRRMNPLFSRDAMAYYESHLLTPTIESVMFELRAARDAAGIVHSDVVPLIRAMLHRISAQITGVDGVNTPQRTERFCLLVEKLAEATTAHFSTKNRQDVVKEGMTTLGALVDEFLSPSLARRQELVKQFKGGVLGKDELPRDALTMLCLHDDDKRKRDDDTAHYAYVWRECALFLHASTSTSVHTFPHVIVHLDQWLKGHPEDSPKLLDSAFLRLAAGESLRLHQTAPVKFRVAIETVTLSSGRTVENGEMVALYAPPANMDASIFGPQAEQFNPYRERIPGAPPWGLTFGYGTHACLGRVLVTGVYNQAGDTTGTEGTMVSILKALYSCDLCLDPASSPQRVTATYHDAYSSVPILLRMP